METLKIEDIKNIFKEIENVINENKDYLVSLDAAMGDGDLGLTMSAGFGAIVNELAKVEDTDIGTVLGKMGMLMANVAPSTMGTLMATAIMKAGKAVKGRSEIGLKDAVDMGYAAIEGIKQRGKADIGDKTILDALHPGVVELEKAMNDGLSFKESFEKAFKGAEQGAENTKNMVSKFGRAAYYGEKSKGKQDPGATVGMLLFKGIYNCLSKY